MEALYALLIHCYHGLLHLASIVNPKAALLQQGRRDSRNSYGKFNPQKAPLILIHCASVGEFEQGLPFFEELKKMFPTHLFLFSFYSPSGYQYAVKRFPELPCTYLPLDTKSRMRDFIQAIQPNMVFLVKYEFWYFFLKTLKQQTIPVYLISGIFRKEQFFFQPWGAFFRQMLSAFTYFFLQDEKSALLLKSIGFANAGVYGDTRFDRVMTLRNSSFTQEEFENFCGKAPIFIGGSIWPSDDTVIQAICKILPSHWKIILAPHELKPRDWTYLHEPVGFYSKQEFSHRILILDTVGLLSRIYRFAHLSYVGGGFGKGIHNTLEAVVYGRPVLIGPNFQKFNEAVTLVERQAMFVMSDEKTVQHFFENTFKNVPELEKIQEKLQEYIKENTNVSVRMAVYLKSINSRIPQSGKNIF